MCGRSYSDYTPADLRLRYFDRSWPFAINTTIPEWSPTYNMCPTQTGLILAVHQGTLGFKPMRWGLVPSWAKSVKDADTYSMINAKSEEITEKKSFKSAFYQRRCIVPVSGFYEWKREGKRKLPFAISLKNDPIMSLAGIWEEWTCKESGEKVLSYSVLTTAANTLMSPIHSRMPVILNRDQERDWLDPQNGDKNHLAQLLLSCSCQTMQAIQVSNLVNSPTNNFARVLEPLQTQGN
jgi:putative SOS response-associated peptidase YedK